MTLGRDAACDIVVDDRKTSRPHAKIEKSPRQVRPRRPQLERHLRRDRDESELGLRREEMILRVRGRIALGHRTSDAEASVVEFYCE